MVIGVCFLMLGMNTGSAYSPGISGPQLSDKAIWFIMSGAVSTVLGIYLLATTTQ